MNPSPQGRVGFLVGAVVIANLLGYTSALVGHARIARRGLMTQEQSFLQRIEPLREHLPSSGIVGYVQDSSSLDQRRIHPAARLPLMRYAFAPLRIAPDEGRPLVIFDSDDPDAQPLQAVAGQWSLLLDRRDGIKLYRVPQED
jgi:hypothetical protein